MEPPHKDGDDAGSDKSTPDASSEVLTARRPGQLQEQLGGAHTDQGNSSDVQGTRVQWLIDQVNGLVSSVRALFGIQLLLFLATACQSWSLLTSNDLTRQALKQNSAQFSQTLSEMQAQTAAAQGAANASRASADAANASALAAQRANQLTEGEQAESRRLIRGRMMVDGVRIGRPIGTGSPLEIAVVFRNMGQSDARGYWQNGAFELVPVGSEFAPTYRDAVGDTDAGSVVEPGGTSVYRGVGGRAPTEEEVLQLNSGTTRIWVWGVIQYTDVYNQTHRRQYCQSLDASTNAVLPCTGHAEND